jgi:hypothetical protein
MRSLHKVLNSRATLENETMKTLLIMTATLALSACAPNYSEGSRLGVVTKLSHKGLIWKSWECSLNQGGTKTTSDEKGNSMVVANAIDFNVSDPTVIAKLQEAMNSGKRVEVSYRQWAIAPPSIENDRVVVAVKDAQ